MSSPFGSMLDGHMRRGGWTQESLAAQSGVHHTFISKIINGHRMPSRANAIAIGKALGLDADDQNRMLKAAGFSVKDASQPSWLTELMEVMDDPRLHPVVRRQMIALIESTTKIGREVMGET